MESLLDHYEQQYAISTADFTAKLAKLSNLDRAGKSHLGQDLEKQIEDLKELLEQMDLEIREVDPSLKPKLKTRLESYKAELTRLQNEYKIKMSTNSNNDGYSSQNELYSELSLREEQKQRLLDTSERIERSNKKLAASYSVLLETEEMGNSVLRDLHSQRETINNSRSRLRETDADLSRSSRLLSAMIARSRQHKIALAATGIVCAVAIVYTIYYNVTKD